jgi:predicted DNA-binding transcriptional regulator AlpA
MNSISSDFLNAAMSASPERLKEALLLLKGESEQKAPSSSIPDRFLTLTELAKVTGIGRMSLFRWRVPGHAHAGRVHYRASEVLSYLESPEFQRTVKALKSNGWKRPSAADVARITLAEENSQAEKCGGLVGDDQHKKARLRREGITHGQI